MNNLVWFVSYVVLPPLSSNKNGIYNNNKNTNKNSNTLARTSRIPLSPYNTNYNKIYNNNNNNTKTNMIFNFNSPLNSNSNNSANNNNLHSKQNANGNNSGFASIRPFSFSFGQSHRPQQLQQSKMHQQRGMAKENHQTNGLANNYNGGDSDDASNISETSSVYVKLSQPCIHFTIVVFFFLFFVFFDLFSLFFFLLLFGSHRRKQAAPKRHHKPKKDGNTPANHINRKRKGINNKKGKNKNVNQKGNNKNKGKNKKGNKKKGKNKNKNNNKNQNIANGTIDTNDENDDTSEAEVTSADNGDEYYTDENDDERSSEYEHSNHYMNGKSRRMYYNFAIFQFLNF